MSNLHQYSVRAGAWIRTCAGLWYFWLIIGIVVGAFVVLGVRFVTYKNEGVHYHANFALYINGQREMFKGSQYYEEDTMCSQSTAPTPMERAHMHDDVNTVIHVEGEAATWGDFFLNLGWYLGPTFLQGPDGVMHAEDATSKLHIILNGNDYTDLGSIADRVIKDQDKLLVSYGDASAQTLQQEYTAIPSTAHHYDVTPDPASCSGHGTTTTMRDRFMHLL
ncbi:MAG TPA: hypothetical protein VFT53_00400 [Candidatus Saccharimonadales bacterium]|nr:hypothetical protein [Candidatus Saccharimonadales bacterium]